MKDNLVDRKSLLAKLLAAENINVVHMKCKTAFFDLNTRTLHCPIWKDMDGDLYDLLLGHEVSHALNTPKEGWHDTVINDKRKHFKGFLNVIEDARIEKKIKRKFPGLRKSFFEAYKMLTSQRDFFGIKGYEDRLGEMNLIDRINLHCKCAHLKIPFFNKEEREYVRRAEALETWDEVVKLANDVYDYVKTQEQNAPQTLQDLIDAMRNQARKNQKPMESDEDEEFDPCAESEQSDDPGEGSEGEDQDSEESGQGKSDPNDVPKSDEREGSNSKSEGKSGEKSGESKKSGEGKSEKDGKSESGASSDKKSKAASDEKSEKTDGGKSGKSSDKKSDDKKEEKGQSSLKGGRGTGLGENVSQSNSNTEPKSITDELFRRHEEELVDKNAKPVYYVELPEAKLENIVNDINKFVVKFDSGCKSQFKFNTSGKLEYSVLQRLIQKNFNSRNGKYIQQLLKEFEMRKNATQYARQLESKSGEIDTTQLSRYKFTNDIFRKITTVTKGKSHGMILFLDLSGSMDPVMHNTIEQLLILVTFCRKAGIPFDVYGFSDSSYGGASRGHKFAQTPNSMSLDGGLFHLKHLISSELNTRLFHMAFNNLLVFGEFGGAQCKEVIEYIKSNNNAPSCSQLFNFRDCGIALSGTPFCETIVASRTLIKKFTAKHHVDILNVIYLTDGQGSMGFYPPTAAQASGYDLQNTRWGIIDPVTKKKILIPLYPNTDTMDVQTGLTLLVKLVTGCRHIGFYITDMNSIRHVVQQSSDVVDREKSLKLLKQNGFASVPNLGYDNYYYIDSKMRVDARSIADSKTLGAEKTFNEFLNIQQQKKATRAILAQFAQEISTSL